MRATLMIGAMMAVSSVAFAGGEACQKSGATADAKACATTCSTTASSFIPAMHIRVGEKQTECMRHAAQLTEELGMPAVYEVAGMEFQCATKAAQAYSMVLSGTLAEATRVRFAVGDECGWCPMSAAKLSAETGAPVRYRVGIRDYATAEEALNASAMAFGTVQQIRMKYAVGESTCDCPLKASDLAASESLPVRYVVGETPVDDQAEAECLLKVKQIRAALGALEVTDKVADKG